ncbi:hypothetical protein, partial [Sulfuricurvum sp.]|uniref:hypothetical protein n=1 Tax=Sulfuricurvum sp. TaxID=2025608 RepID=UPI0025E97BB4
ERKFENFHQPLQIFSFCIINNYLYVPNEIKGKKGSFCHIQKIWQALEICPYHFTAYERKVGNISK